MTELVVGKRLAIPPSKDLPTKVAAFAELGPQCKVHFHAIENKSKVLQSYLKDPPSALKLKRDSNLKSLVDSEFNSKFHDQAVYNSERFDTTVASCDDHALSNDMQESKVALSPNGQSTSDSLNSDAVIDLPSMVGGAHAESQDASRSESATETEDQDESSKDEKYIPELDTNTSLGKSVAFLMGKSVPKHQNIFDLMDSTASKWIKKSLGKKSISSMLLEQKQNEMLLEAQQRNGTIESVTGEISDSVTEQVSLVQNQSVQLPSIEIKNTSLQSLSDIGDSATQRTFDQRESVVLPSIFTESSFSVFKRERKGAKSPPILHNHSIKEAFKLKFENLKMGEGRFSFDDIEAKTKDQLIYNLKQKGDKTDLKELQKESESKLRAFLKERLENASYDMKFRSDGNLPFSRIEQMLSRRAPEPKCPSPETIKKWHATAIRAGVPLEALMRYQNNLVTIDEPVETASKRAESKIEVQKSIDTRARPTAASIPRIVNPDHIELLLSQSLPKLYSPSHIAVSVQVPLRIARNDVLWKKLCALE